ncbi:4-hydroxy-L-threonine phosphate dehydrogenase PdxA [Arthrobacter sp. V4I6]|uniref:4-hydroxythreonine-4-phosphate dehydrogenase PdxA n=2 Tax=unclassified Arthrobacter TaxID=235627 RepID=UPI00277DF98F|nr:4-hydroxythreonine-4-phosphate dehydrogenase PdxA [Arthrobacter sp. V4I6]MDQ0851956.1 4-hydroxy-L-threonine phosphate dehydrogenase PdxA [Arthrobacter sp. V4I6]
MSEPSEALFDGGTIDMLDIDCIPADLTWGELSAAAGHGSYLFIEKAVALAMDRQVDAICTGPLNKAALHAARPHRPYRCDRQDQR